MGCAKVSGEGRGGSQADGVVLLARIGEMETAVDELRRANCLAWGHGSRGKERGNVEEIRIYLKTRTGKHIT